MTKANVQKGLFRIYMVANVITVILTVVYLVREEKCYFTPSDIIGFWGNYWPGLTIMLLICAAPWAAHYIAKWIMRGFTGRSA